MKYVECKNLNKNKAANSQNYFSPISEKIVDINGSDIYLSVLCHALNTSYT